MLNLREIEIFHAIMVGGSITEAARILCVSQPAVSVAIRHAEDKIGVSLFLREKGRISPTKEALELFPEIESLFEKLEAVQKITKDLRNTRTGLLSIAGTPTLAQTFLAGAISRFRSERQGVRVLIEVTHKRHTVELARKGQIDLGFVFSPSDIPMLRSETLVNAELVCILPKGHPLAGKNTISPRDISRYPLITKVSDQTSPQLEEAFRKSGLERNFAIACNMTTTAVMLVEAGAGIAIVEPWISRKNFPDLVFKAFRPRIKIRFSAIHSQTEPLSLLAAAFLDVVKEEAELHGADYMSIG